MCLPHDREPKLPPSLTITIAPYVMMAGPNLRTVTIMTLKLWKERNELKLHLVFDSARAPLMPHRSIFPTTRTRRRTRRTRTKSKKLESCTPVEKFSAKW
jgi:hypothetical protein